MVSQPTVIGVLTAVRSNPPTYTNVRITARQKSKGLRRGPAPCDRTRKGCYPNHSANTL